MKHRAVVDNPVLRVMLGRLNNAERANSLVSLLEESIKSGSKKEVLLFLQLVWASMLELDTLFYLGTSDKGEQEYVLRFELCQSDTFNRLLTNYTSIVSSSYYTVLSDEDANEMLVAELTCEMFMCAALLPDDERAITLFYPVLYGWMKNPLKDKRDMADILRIAIKDLPEYSYKKSRLRKFLKVLKEKLLQLEEFIGVPEPQREENIKKTEKLVRCVGIAICKESSPTEIFNAFLEK